MKNKYGHSIFKIFFVFSLVIISCGQKNKDSIEQISIEQKAEDFNENPQLSLNNSININSGESHENIELYKPTVLIQKLDSLEIEQIKKQNGEENFYTAADDLMFYNSELLDKLDSLKIDVIFSDKDTLFVKANDANVVINKNSNSDLHSYYYFDGKIIRKTDLFELLDY